MLMSLKCVYFVLFWCVGVNKNLNQRVKLTTGYEVNCLPCSVL